jgi:hypothetical protein
MFNFMLKVIFILFEKAKIKEVNQVKLVSRSSL